jgi:hypothetical protein
MIKAFVLLTVGFFPISGENFWPGFPQMLRFWKWAPEPV